jgi:hypothetical protein
LGGELTLDVRLEHVNRATQWTAADLEAGISDLALDTSGNIYVVGSSLGQPLQNPIQTTPATNVAAINPQTHTVLFSSYISGGATLG